MPEQNQLVTILKEGNIEKSESQKLYMEFAPLFNTANEFEREAKSIKVDSIDQKDEMKKAREMRLKLVRFRGECDNKRKELKEESLRKGRAIDGMANIIKYLFVSTEEYLKKQEDFAKIIEEQRREKLGQKRNDELSKYTIVSMECYDLKNMSEEAYGELLTTFKERHEMRIERGKKEEEERIAALKKETERLKKLEEDNVRMRKEAEENEIKLEEEKKEREERQVEIDAVIKEEEEERQKKEEEEREERKKKDAKKEAELKKERKKREKVEEELAEKNKIEKEKVDAIKKAATDKINAPTKERLMEFSRSLKNLEQPTFEPGDNADSIMTRVDGMIRDIRDYIETSSNNL